MHDHKIEMLKTWLASGMIMIHFDGRHDGAILPESLTKDAHVRLNLSYRFDPPDLELGENGVGGTLTFPSGQLWCFIPYASIFGVTSHVSKHFHFFEESAPAEILGKLTATAPVVTERPKLRLIKGGLA